MEVESFFTILVLLVGFYMSWSIGANDVSNAMGTSVGSGALTLKRAVILAAILEFSGAFFVGSNVSETMQRGIIDTDVFLTDPTLLILGMCAALLATGGWLQIASYCGWPVSTTHAIVGSIVGFGFIVGGAEAIQWDALLTIVFSWVASPTISGILAYLLFLLLQKKILYALNPIQATKKLFPVLIFIVFFVFSLILLFKGLENINLSLSFPGVLLLSALLGLLAGSVSYFLIKRVKTPESYPKFHSRSPQNIVSLEKAVKHLQRVQANTLEETQSQVSDLLKDVRQLTHNVKQETTVTEKTSEYQTVEKMFVYLQILSACFVAFAHGANDVANAIGPVAAVLDVIKNGAISDIAVVPAWLLAFGGVGIVVGLATWGWKVIETIGKKITELTPTRGFCAEFSAATTILLASKLGLPISTTHCIVGAVLGVGMARGMKALNLNMIKEIVLSWVITIPASAIMSISIFYFLRTCFLQFFTGH
jgi:inorganic phosphate transporter, PiT family